MNIVSVALLGIVGIMPAIILKSVKSEYSVIISIGIALIIFGFILIKLETLKDALDTFAGYINMDKKYITILLKMTGITYIAEFSSSLCRDAGYNAVSSQIELFAKLSVLIISIPIITALLDTINGFM